MLFRDQDLFVTFHWTIVYIRPCLKCVFSHIVVYLRKQRQFELFRHDK